MCKTYDLLQYCKENYIFADTQTHNKHNVLSFSHSVGNRTKSFICWCLFPHHQIEAIKCLRAYATFDLFRMCLRVFLLCMSEALCVHGTTRNLFIGRPV